MTLAQQLRNEGFEKGMIQGIAKGVVEGKAEGRAEGEKIGFTRCRQEFFKNIAKKLLKKVGLIEQTNTIINDIGIGKQQLVEIAKALSKNVELLILDEPTAALNETESENLLNLLVEL